MQVKATKRGFDGLKEREPGEVFDMPDDSKGSWFEPATDGDDKPKKAGKSPPKEKGEVIPPDPAA